ncbi:MAG: DNA polymerase III subunit alpha [Alphaproteobacteria bacterium]|nr:DNA polymerase III subunit alpha [Alphaproteobacteria bacterium]
MSHADFVHLRVHTAYSLSEGAIKIKALADLCRQNAMPAVAITDTNNLFGALEFVQAMLKAGVQPVMGCQLALSRDDEGRALATGRALRRPDPDPLVLLAQDEAGYANLMRLSSAAYLDNPPGEAAQVGIADLERHAAGLICLTGGAFGPVGRLLAEGQGPAAEARLRHLAAIFPGRLYVELQRHGLPEEARAEAGLVDLAFRLDLPLVATNDCYFAGADMYEAHDALLCIAGGAYLSQQDRRRLTVDHRFKSAEEMKVLFADLPEATANTLVIARRCAVMAEERKPILPSFTREPGDEPAVLRRMAEEGLERRIATLGLDDLAAAPYRERLAFELKVIIEMGFAGYFLIVADFIQWAKAAGIPVGPGRGSGAGSCVAWALTITDLDPLRFGLLFERFLNPERVSMPDFDIDFCQDRRDEVIRYVQSRYGHDQVAQIITFGKLQARAALRDVGRVLEMPYGQVDRLCKMVPNNPANPVTLEDAIAGEPRLQHERDSDETVARLLDIALRLEGLYRHASTHAAGVVIGDRPLRELVPLYRDPRSDMLVTQFSMKYAEAAGLVKFDFLGLKTLTVIERALRLLARRGKAPDWDRLPYDDKPTYAMLSRGEAVGVFQLESSGMRDVLRRLKPDTIEDIIAIVALYRPGPMDNIPKFINCKHGLEKPDYLHPWLEPVLKETYGVIVYQEQVMQIAQILAGYSLGEADLLRRAMGKKIKAEMDAQRERFVQGALAKGVDAAKAEYIFDLVAKFAGYGFNKSHAAAYAIVAYQTAWLKANHPVEFLAASMSLDLSNTDKLNVFRQECARLGIALRQPDINRSEVEFSVEDDGGKGAIRYALAAVKNVGAAAMAGLVRERETGGRFASLADFAGRLDPQAVNKRQLENLARAGAFDALDTNRHRVFAGIEMLLRHAGAAAQDRGSNQASLFGAALALAAELHLPDLPDWPAMERLRQEYDAIGFYLSAHPLDAYGRSLAQLGVRRYAELARVAGGGRATSLRIAGTVLGRQERTSARGNRFAFVQASDPSGMFEVTVFSDVLAQARQLLEPGKGLIFTVEAKVENEQLRLTVQGVQAIEDVAEQAAAGVRIFLREAAPLGGIRGVLERTPKGRGLVELVLALDDRREEVEMQLPGAFAITPAVRAALKGVPGVVDLHDL